MKAQKKKDADKYAELETANNLLEREKKEDKDFQV